MVLKIFRYPSVELRQDVIETGLRPGEKLGHEAFAGITDMLQALGAAPQGAALAANQVGYISLRAFVVAERVAREHSFPQIVIDPRTTQLGNQFTEEMEGCLSFGDLRVRVRRPKSIKLNFLTPARGGLLEQRELLLDGFMARCAQHETDHLDGKTFVDSLPRHERERIAIEIARSRRA